MTMDFASTPPDITSALVYSGAGAGPLMAAAAAYNNLAAEVSAAATQWESIIATLTSDVWTGAGSTAAAASAETIVQWLTTTAASLETVGAQATASAAAYEAAYAGVVPPPVILQNRIQLAHLVATNVLGQNTPAILATEALYSEMWVQDATTMYTYEAAATASGVLPPIAPEAQATNPGGSALQSAAADASSTSPVTQALSSNLSGVTSNSLLGNTTSLSNLLDGSGINIGGYTLTQWSNIPIIQNLIYNVGVTVAWNSAMMTATFPLLGHFLASAPLGVTPFVDDVSPLGAGLGMGTTLVGSTAPAGVGGAAAAAVGEAGAVGGLSVPATWSSAAAPVTLASSTAPLEGSGWTVAAETAEGGPVAAMPGMPGMGAAKGAAGAYAGPRYGTKPIVMPKPVGV